MSKSLKFSLLLSIIIVILYSCQKSSRDTVVPEPKHSGIDPHEDLELFELNDSTIKAEYATAREAKLEFFSCTDCHDEPKESWSLEALKEDGSHDEILSVYKHANSETMDCMTCHSLNDRDQLRMLNNKKISFDESFMLCGQCHSNKYKDWKKGAHGKRVGKWSGAGVYQNCADCHNPHFPASAYPKRKPVVDATLMRKGLEKIHSSSGHADDKNEAETGKAANSILADYKSKCSKCHGQSGEGITGKANKPAINHLGKVDDEKLFTIIKDGYKGDIGKMPGFAKKFSDEKISELVKFVKSLDKTE